MDNVSCPFCGNNPYNTGEHLNGIPAYRHPGEPSCPLVGAFFTAEQWQMRPPKKGQPKPVVLSEVEWLRQMVAALTLEAPEQNYTIALDSMKYQKKEGEE